MQALRLICFLDKGRLGLTELSLKLLDMFLLGQDLLLQLFGIICARFGDSSFLFGCSCTVLNSLINVIKRLVHHGLVLFDNTIDHFTSVWILFLEELDHLFN